MCGIVGESLLACTISIDQNLIDLAGRAGIAISSGGRSRGADLASSIHSSQSLEAAASLGSSIVDLIGTAFSGTDTPLVGKETSKAVTVRGDRVVSGVDGTGHTVSVGNKVSNGTGLA